MSAGVCPLVRGLACISAGGAGDRFGLGLEESRSACLLGLDLFSRWVTLSQEVLGTYNRRRFCGDPVAIGFGDNHS